MTSPFEMTPAYSGMDASRRCGVSLCGHQHEVGDTLCGYHRELLGHLGAHQGQAEDGCWFCPDGPGLLSSHHEERLAYLAGIEDGWLDGHGRAVTAAALAAGRAFIAAAPFADGAALSCFPGEDGEIVFEDSSSDETGWLFVDATPDGGWLLYVPLLPDDVADPAHDAGMVFAHPDVLWEHVLQVRATGGV